MNSTENKILWILWSLLNQNKSPMNLNFLSFKDVQYSKIANIAINRSQIVLRNETDSMHL